MIANTEALSRWQLWSGVGMTFHRTMEHGVTCVLTCARYTTYVTTRSVTHYDWPHNFGVEIPQRDLIDSK